MTQRDDERLRETFRGLRAEVRASGSVPGFGAMMAEAKHQADERPRLEVVAGGAGAGRIRGGRKFFRAGAWVSATVAAAVAGLILIDRAPSGDEDFERLVAAYASQVGAAGWQSPTSGLLDVPGMDLTRSLPSIGGPVRGIDPATRPAPQPSPQEDNL